MALQVALYTASGSSILFAAILIHVLLQFGKQLNRVVAAVERLEAEVTPLARETRAVVDQVRDISEGAQRVAGIASGLVLPSLSAFNRTSVVFRTGITAFLRALWSGPRHPEQNARA